MNATSRAAKPAYSTSVPRVVASSWPSVPARPESAEPVRKTLWGRASDLYGRKPLFVAAIVAENELETVDAHRLVYWRLESFEDELLPTIRELEPGESALAAFGRFVRAPRGMLDDYDAEALAALTAMIVSRPGAVDPRAADPRSLHGRAGGGTGR